MDFGKRQNPCDDCMDGHCTMNCGPAMTPPAPNYAQCCTAPIAICDCVNPDHIGVNYSPPKSDGNEVNAISCPWCGPMNGHYGFTIGRFGTRLTCFCCDSHGPRAATREKAITAWNTRPAPSLAEALAVPEVAALVESVKPYISPAQNADYGRQIQQYEALLEAFSKIKAVG